MVPQPEGLRRIRVLDATLRDGDQAAGFAFSAKAKLDIARALAVAGVDVVEAGFPLSSRADGESCARIASEFASSSDMPAVSFLCRSITEDIELTARFFDPNCRSILHLSLPVSDIHIRAKFGSSRSSVLERAVASVRVARTLTHEVEMGAEDATRADRSFLAEYCDAVTSAGANTVNIADTVGRALSDEFGELVSYLVRTVPAFRDGTARVSVHCHDDLGLAAANTVAGIRSGCTQIEVCALGLGERAGNTALEELAAIIATRSDTLGVSTGIRLPALGPLTRLVSRECGTSFSPLKSITGSNVRAHASGIHQQALARDPETYEAAFGALVDAVPERIVLSRHSGKAGVESAAREYAGVELSADQAVSLLARIKEALPDDEPSFGITEFLSLLKEHNLVRVPILLCDDVGYSFARGSSPESEAIALVAQASGTDFSVRTMSVSGYTAGEQTKYRAYLEVTYPGEESNLFAVERTGFDRERVLVNALLDAVNSRRCLQRA